MAIKKDNRRKALQTKRNLAKAGMGASMAVLFWTALSRNRRLMRHHALAGITLTGFTLWHMMLYKGNGSNRSHRNRAVRSRKKVTRRDHA